MTEQLPSIEIVRQPLSAEQVMAIGSELLLHFGVDINTAMTDPKGFETALKAISPRYKEDGTKLRRMDLEGDITELGPETDDIIMRAADALRMLDVETPLKGDYDVVIVLGGARQAPKDRNEFVKNALKSGAATAGMVIEAGSTRKLMEDEKFAVTKYVPDANTEFDLCMAAAKVITSKIPTQPIYASKVKDEKAGSLAVIERALATAQALGGLPAGARVAVVTTQIYSAAAAVDLARFKKKFGLGEPGVAASPSDKEVIDARSISTYLSEVVRTIRTAAEAINAQ